MSETEFHHGIIELIPYKDLGYETVEDYCKQICCDSNITCGTYTDYVKENYYEKYLINGDKIYVIVDTSEEPGHFMNIQRVGPDKYSYATEFYNGGTCLSEMLKEAIENVF